MTAEKNRGAPDFKNGPRSAALAFNNLLPAEVHHSGHNSGKAPRLFIRIAMRNDFKKRRERRTVQQVKLVIGQLVDFNPAPFQLGNEPFPVLDFPHD